MTRLDGKRILLTGSAGALGRALTRRFLEEGTAALALIDIDEDGLAEVVLETEGRLSVQVIAEAVDVRDLEAMQGVVQRVADSFVGLDVVVNNAGVLTAPARIHNIDPVDLRRTMDINLYGVFNGMRAAIPLLRRAGAGSIINTASVSGLTAWSRAGAYCAAKAAAISLTKVGAVEYASEGIRVKLCLPRSLPHRDLRWLAESSLDQIVARHPIGRFAEVAEIIGAYVYLASDEATFVTGTSLVVDGGYTAP